MSSRAAKSAQAEDLGINATYQSDPDPGKAKLTDRLLPLGLKVLSPATPSSRWRNPRRAQRLHHQSHLAAGKSRLSPVDSGLERFQEFGRLTHIGQSEYIAGQGAGEKARGLPARRTSSASSTKPEMSDSKTAVAVLLDTLGWCGRECTG